jgi:hypothetical protein
MGYLKDNLCYTTWSYTRSPQSILMLTIYSLRSQPTWPAFDQWVPSTMRTSRRSYSAQVWQFFYHTPIRRWTFFSHITLTGYEDLPLRHILPPCPVRYINVVASLSRFLKVLFLKLSLLWLVALQHRVFAANSSWSYTCSINWTFLLFCEIYSIEQSKVFTRSVSAQVQWTL